MAAAPIMRRAASVAFPEHFERAASAFLPDQVGFRLDSQLPGMFTTSRMQMLT